jgi:hypothetical protein
LDIFVVVDQGVLLDLELDEAIGDRRGGGRIFSDDVRSDTIGGIPDKDH